MEVIGILRLPLTQPDSLAVRCSQLQRVLIMKGNIQMNAKKVLVSFSQLNSQLADKIGKRDERRQQRGDELTLNFPVRAGTWFGVDTALVTIPEDEGQPLILRKVWKGGRKTSDSEQARAVNTMTARVFEGDLSRDRLLVVYHGRAGTYHQLFELVRYVDNEKAVTIVPPQGEEIPQPGVPALVTATGVSCKGTFEEGNTSYVIVPAQVLGHHLREFALDREQAQVWLHPAVVQAFTRLYEFLAGLAGYGFEYDETGALDALVAEGDEPLTWEELTEVSDGKENILLSYPYIQELTASGVTFPEAVVEYYRGEWNRIKRFQFDLRKINVVVEDGVETVVNTTQLVVADSDLLA